MEVLHLTAHAEKRANQRGIRRETLVLLLDYGSASMRGGAEVIYMDQTARRRVREDLGAKAYARIERALDAYLVLADDGRVITCAHRRKPLRFRN